MQIVDECIRIVHTLENIPFLSSNHCSTGPNTICVTGKNLYPVQYSLENYIETHKPITSHFWPNIIQCLAVVSSPVLI